MLFWEIQTPKHLKECIKKLSLSYFQSKTEVWLHLPSPDIPARWQLPTSLPGHRVEWFGQQSSPAVPVNCFPGAGPLLHFLLLGEAMPRPLGTAWPHYLLQAGLGTGLLTCRTNQGPLTLHGEGLNVSSLPPGSVETHAMYICMFVRCNVMEGTLGLFGSSVCQELEAKKRQENKIKRKRSHARWTAMFPYLLCLQCFVNRFQ